MNVVVLTGFHEYLEPTAVPADELVVALRALEPRVFLPQPRWIADPDEDVDLFLEYLEDIAPPGDVPVLVLPREGLLAAARRRFGETAIRLRRVYLSQATEAVLGRLQPDRGHEPAAGDWPISCAGMLRNYTQAVLRLVEPLVERDGLFSSSLGPDGLADLLAASGFHLRPDLGPDRLLAELRPGGELHALFSRPFLAAGSPESATLARAG